MLSRVEMLQCRVKNWQGEEVGTAPLELKGAKEENASHLVHRAVVRHLANARQGYILAQVRCLDVNRVNILPKRGGEKFPGGLDSLSNLSV
jgi:ribosomal protein L4